MSNAVVVGVDVGGTNIRMGAVDRDGALTHERIFGSRQLLGDQAAEGLLDSLKLYISQLQAPVRAVSIGFPSTMNRDRTLLLNTPNLKGLDNLPIGALYETALGIPLFTNKDATMLLHYDMYKLGIGQDGIVAGIYIGTGIGNSVIADGREWTGWDGVACELGHIPVPGRSDPCSCGLKGCLELYAGGKGLERICAAYFPNTPIGEVFAQHGDAPQIQAFVSAVADAVVIESHILNPKCVVLGGGVLQMECFPKERLLATILEKTRGPIPRDTLKVLFSDHQSPYNGVVGSALYAIKQLQK